MTSTLKPKEWRHQIDQNDDYTTANRSLSIREDEPQKGIHKNTFKPAKRISRDGGHVVHSIETIMVIR